MGFCLVVSLPGSLIIVREQKMPYNIKLYGIFIILY